VCHDLDPTGKHIPLYILPHFIGPGEHGMMVGGVRPDTGWKVTNSSSIPGTQTLLSQAAVLHRSQMNDMIFRYQVSFLPSKSSLHHEC